MAKHVTNSDEAFVAVVQKRLGTESQGVSVPADSREAAAQRSREVDEALEALAQMPPLDRSEPWR